MGNCSRVCKNKDAIDMNLSAQIHSSIKKNISRKEHSIVELGTRQEKFFYSIQWLESDSEDFFSLFRESSNDYDDDDAVNNYPNMKDELEDKAVMLNKLLKSRSKSPHESISNSIGSNKARCFLGEEKPAHEI
ncbi:hypothetical protein ES288_D12G178700v1 [Gossypium darwinii]|uniref:Uncharacterized protein n=2 Tax=Gossypium TaxID=3633 RepID=A0A5D2IA16_GOSTO|nr:hypothetical protein ES288_D12G178700v1 [Gossypium darwinii]TYH39454.1 hypothetical protein ES332_D12G179800v1 [Gossypium tomentosum]